MKLTLSTTLTGYSSSAYLLTNKSYHNMPPKQVYQLQMWAKLSDSDRTDRAPQVNAKHCALPIT